jgi:enoyl-CoA hydratase
MSTQRVSLSITGPVALVVLNDPARRNALSAEMVREISAAFDAAEGESEVRAIVLTGRGPAFCAGAVLDTLLASADGHFDDVKGIYDGFLRVLHSSLPTIAAVNGPAIGAGFNLALACDIRMASTAARFETRFTRLQLHPGGGHTWLLDRAVGHQQAVLACLFGEVWDAEQALDRGLVAAVHRDDALIDAAIALGSRLGGTSAALVRRVSATVKATRQMPAHADALVWEEAAQRWSVGEPEFVAGVRAVRDRIAAKSAHQSHG